MSYLDDYRSTVAIGGGNSSSSQIKQTTIQFVNQSFTDSPFYFNIPIDNVNTDVRINSVAGVDTKKTLTFRPETTVKKGSVATINGEYWMCLESDGTDVFPKGEYQRCNAHLNWITPDNLSHSYPAWSTSYVHKLNYESNQTFVTIGDADLYVMCPYNNDTSGVRIGMRFFVGLLTYIVMGVDDVTYHFNGEGMMYFAMKLDPIRATDNASTGVADNSNYFLQKNKSSEGKVGW